MRQNVLRMSDMPEPMGMHSRVNTISATTASDTDNNPLEDLQELQKLAFCLREALPVRGVDSEQQALGALEVVLPQRPVRCLPCDTTFTFIYIHILTHHERKAWRCCPASSSVSAEATGWHQQPSWWCSYRRGPKRKV